tara:strand:- start:1238 stop:1849 length:612 start_codon:yes stop_codon:yes gene_type:complete
MFNTIVNPKTNKRVKLNTTLGRNILNKYINTSFGGGINIESIDDTRSEIARERWKLALDWAKTEVRCPQTIIIDSAPMDKFNGNYSVCMRPGRYSKGNTKQLQKYRDHPVWNNTYKSLLPELNMEGISNESCVYCKNDDFNKIIYRLQKGGIYTWYINDLVDGGLNYATYSNPLKVAKPPLQGWLVSTYLGKSETSLIITPSS